MQKVVLDYFVNSIGAQAVATICVAVAIVRLFGDEKLAAGMQRLLRMIDESLQMPDLGPDWYVRPMATIRMTVSAVAAAYFFVFLIAALWVVMLGQRAELHTAILAVMLLACSMAFCLRTARSSYEVLRRRSAKRAASRQQLALDGRFDSRRGF
jgi:hypothetical protein